MNVDGTVSEVIRSDIENQKTISLISREQQPYVACNIGLQLAGKYETVV